MCASLALSLQAWLWHTARFARRLAAQAMPELVDEGTAADSQAWVTRPRGSLDGVDRTLKAPGYEQIGLNNSAPEDVSAWLV